MALFWFINTFAVMFGYGIGDVKFSIFMTLISILLVVMTYLMDKKL